MKKILLINILTLMTLTIYNTSSIAKSKEENKVSSSNSNGETEISAIKKSNKKSDKFDIFRIKDSGNNGSTDLSSEELHFYNKKNTDKGKDLEAIVNVENEEVKSVELYDKREDIENDTWEEQVPHPVENYTTTDFTYRKADKPSEIITAKDNENKTFKKYQKEYDKINAPDVSERYEVKYEEILEGNSNLETTIEQLSRLKDEIKDDYKLKKSNKRDLKKEIKQKIKSLENELIKELKCDEKSGKEKRQCKKSAKSHH